MTRTAREIRADLREVIDELPRNTPPAILRTLHRACADLEALHVAHADPVRDAAPELLVAAEAVVRGFDDGILLPWASLKAAIIKARGDQ